MIRGRKSDYLGGEYAEDEYEYEKFVTRAKYVTVINDPTGDFRKGAEFMSRQFAKGMADKIWPVGMTVEYDGEAHRVLERDPRPGMRSQALERISDGEIIRL
jgi:hypothetical protein